VSRLAVKIELLIVVVLVIGFGLSTVVTIQREADLLVEQNKLAARRLTATLVASIEGAMLQERPDVTRTVIQELKQSSPVEEFAVYRRTGVEAFTDLTTAMEVDRNAGLAKDVLDNIKRMAREPGQTASGPQFLRAVETLTTQESLETHEGDTFFTLYTRSSTRRSARAVTAATTRSARWCAWTRRWRRYWPRCAAIVTGSFSSAG